MRSRLAPTRIERLVDQSWRQLAVEFNGQLDVRRLRMELKLGKFSLNASIAPFVESREPTVSQPRRNRTYWATRLDVRLTPPLRPRLEIVESGREAISRLPVVVGGTEFDQAFTVYAKSQRAVRSLLDDDARRALLALRASVQRLELESRRLRVEIDDPVTEEPRLRQLIALLQAAADALTETRVHRGPYR